jgi:bla regulator protein blaR1
MWPGIMSVGRAHGQWIGTTMKRIADHVSGEIGSIVVDGTGLTGKYDISLDWTPEPKGMVVPSLVETESKMPSAPEPSGPTLLKALQEQLGLNLQPKTVPMKILVIDHADKSPTEN